MPTAIPQYWLFFTDDSLHQMIIYQQFCHFWDKTPAMPGKPQFKQLVMKNSLTSLQFWSDSFVKPQIIPPNVLHIWCQCCTITELTFYYKGHVEGQMLLPNLNFRCVQLRNNNPFDIALCLIVYSDGLNGWLVSSGTLLGQWLWGNGTRADRYLDVGFFIEFF